MNKMAGGDPDPLLKLGEAIVARLALRDTGDLPARWMAHHVASCIAEARAAKGDARTAAATRCREAILDLWEHRAELPSGKRPLETIEPLLATIEALDPDRTTPFQHRRVWSAIGPDVPAAVAASLSAAREADRAARLVVGALLGEAADRIGPEAAAWATLATDAGVGHSFDVRLFLTLKGKNGPMQHQHLRAERLRDKIALLTGLIEHASTLSVRYQAELAALPDETNEVDSSDW